MNTTTLWQTVLDYWFGDSLAHGWPEVSRNDFWFRADTRVDQEIRQRFEPLASQALEGGLSEWEAEPLSRLALIIVLDQFPRNIWRGNSQAFAGDARALSLALDGLHTSLDHELPWIGRVFFYMPLMHAEDIAVQMRSVGCYERLVAEAPQHISEKLEGNLHAAVEHQQTISRFGRFPARNKALGRENTPEEEAFLTPQAETEPPAEPE